MWVTGCVSAVVLLLFVMEIKNELEEERWWKNRGRE